MLKPVVHQKIAILNIPGLADVYDVDTILTGLPEVVLHVNLEVLGAEVALSGQQGLDVLAGGVHDGGQVGGSHLDGFVLLSGLTKGWLGRVTAKRIVVLRAKSRKTESSRRNFECQNVCGEKP